MVAAPAVRFLSRGGGQVPPCGSPAPCADCCQQVQKLLLPLQSPGARLARAQAALLRAGSYESSQRVPCKPCTEHASRRKGASGTCKQCDGGKSSHCVCNCSFRMGHTAPEPARSRQWRSRKVHAPHTGIPRARSDAGRREQLGLFNDACALPSYLKSCQRLEHAGAARCSEALRTCRQGFFGDPSDCEIQSERLRRCARHCPKSE